MVFPPADDFLFCLIACCGHGGAPCIGGHALPGFLSRQFLRRAACFLLLCLFGRFALYVRAGEVDARLTQERGDLAIGYRSEEHTSELQSLMRISYAVFCLKKKTHKNSYTSPIFTTIQQYIR